MRCLLWNRAWVAIAALGVVASIHAQPLRNQKFEARPDAGAAVKSSLSDELARVERELAGWMIRRVTGGLDANAREYLELGIDLRVIQRTILAAAVDSTPFTNEQALLWHRSRQLQAAIRGLDDALAQAPAGGPNLAQKASMQIVRKLSFEIAGAKAGATGTASTATTTASVPANLDEFCRNLAVALVNCVNTNPIDGKSMPVMRPPAPPREEPPPKDQPATLAELAERVQRSAAISIPLRQHLLELVKNASEEKANGPAYQMLNQVATLARGLQGNTAVTAEQRSAIEMQVTEGLAMFMDPRTRDAGKARIDSLAQYRQLLNRVGKLSLSREQMAQLSPALTWAQTAGEAGQKFMSALERYFDLCAKWDALPAGPNAGVPPMLKRAHEELVSHFAKERLALWNEATKVGTGTTTGSQIVAGDLEPHLNEMARMHAVAEDLLGQSKSLDTLSAYKPRPSGGLEKRAQTAASAAASLTPSLLRSDGEQFLKATRRLAELAQRLSARPLSEIPPNVAQAWAGVRLDLFETRWKGLVTDLASVLAGGAGELDRAKLARLEASADLSEALRAAVQLEQSLAKAPLLMRWVDWGIEPASIQTVIAPYKETMAAAFTGFASDLVDPVERWHKVHPRYAPLIALINHDAAYAEQCEKMPIGFAGDIARLATKMENAPFLNDRFAAYAIAMWATFETTGDELAADRTAMILARRLSKQPAPASPVDEAPLPRKKPKTP
jgi:hypothetical protein